MRERERTCAILGLMLVLLLFVPPVRDGLERSMTTHVAIQLAGLATTGWLFGAALRRRFAGVADTIDAHGLCGLMICLFATLFWMLPRTLDEALTNPWIEIAKFLTVPLLVGFPLATFWFRLNPIVRGFVKATLVSKLFVLGWIYTSAPDRLCTSYYQIDQILLGQLMLIVAGMLGIGWSLPCFLLGGGDERPQMNPASQTR